MSYNWNKFVKNLPNPPTFLKRHWWRTWTTFLIVFALWPNINVDLVSVSLKDAGEQQMMIVVLALPPANNGEVEMHYLVHVRVREEDSE